MSQSVDIQEQINVARKKLNELTAKQAHAKAEKELAEKQLKEATQLLADQGYTDPQKAHEAIQEQTQQAQQLLDKATTVLNSNE